MKDYDKSKESPYRKYWNVNNLYGWAMSQKVPVNHFKWIEDTSQFNQNFIKRYKEKNDEGYSLEVERHNDLPFHNCMNVIMLYHFYNTEE